jgi:hypothetical protein
MADDLLGGAGRRATLRVGEIGSDLDRRDHDLAEEVLVIGVAVTPRLAWFRW